MSLTTDLFRSRLVSSRMGDSTILGCFDDYVGFSRFETVESVIRADD